MCIRDRAVELVHPAITRHKRVRAGTDVMFKCKADARTTITWYFNSSRLIDSRGVYIISSVERGGGVATGSGGVANSELHLQPARRRHSGQYSCRNAQDPSDGDSIVLTVRDNQQGTDLYLCQSMTTCYS